MERKEFGSFEIGMILDALQERHGLLLEEDERFELSGYRSKAEVYAKMILRNEDESFHYPVECRIDIEENELPDVQTAQDLVLDFLDYYFGRYLKEDRELYLTIDWSTVEFDNYKLWAKGQILNLKMERMAEKWLSGEVAAEKPN